jgi:short subunit dehydrogenase-like uncharacterized protein
VTGADRELDVVVYGASGFVGRLTAAYLATAAPATARIALAGRSAAKLEQVRGELPPAARDWPLLVADTTEPATLARLAEAAHVVATTVGPYQRYGLPLVEACATAGTNYADLTGEALFMRESIDRYDQPARASGARIVHSCGFDSIPFDLGVQLTYDAVRAAGDGELESTTAVVTALKGGVSGGTIDSMRAQLEQMHDPAKAALAADPYALSPDRDAEPDLGDEGELRGVVHDPQLQMWLAPFVMAQVNTRVVRRSNALQGWAYGRRFRYREVMGFRGPGAVVKAGAVAGGLAAFAAGMATAPVRAVLDRVLPSPGQGPSERLRAGGFFRIELYADTSTGAQYLTRVSANGDPGYQATAVMLGESALALSLDHDRLPARSGVLTPATGIGAPLVDRLRAQSFTFETARRHH